MHEELANLPVTFALFQYHHCVQGYVIQKIRRRQRAVRVLFDQVEVSQKNGAKLRLYVHRTMRKCSFANCFCSNLIDICWHKEVYP